MFRVGTIENWIIFLLLMNPPLEVLIGVNWKEPVLAKGWDTYTLLHSIGYDARYFTDNGNLITEWIWQKDADGPTANRPKAYGHKKSKEEEPRLSARERAELRRLRAWID